MLLIVCVYKHANQELYTIDKEIISTTQFTKWRQKKLRRSLSVYGNQTGVKISRNSCKKWVRAKSEISKVSYKQPITSSWLLVLRKVSYQQPATCHQEKLATSTQLLVLATSPEKSQVLVASYMKIIGNYVMHTRSATSDYTRYLQISSLILYLLIINIPFFLISGI